MTKQGHTKEDLIEYLLGSASEGAGERFDALSVSDSEFADELDAVEADLVDAYVQGELSGDRLNRFETQYLTSPLRRDKVEFARTFHRYAEAHSFAGATAQPMVAKAPTRRRSFSSWFETFNNMIPSMRWGFALATAILLAAGVWWIFQGSPRHSDNPSIASFVLAPPLRGNNQTPALSIPKGTAVVAIQLELESDDYPAYDVTLLDQTANRSLWRDHKSAMTSGADHKAITVAFPAAVLKRQTYFLRLTGIPAQGDPEIVGDYSFVVK